MKILWLVNCILPQIADSIGISRNNRGGWLTQLSEHLSNMSDIELCVVFIQSNQSRTIEGRIEKLEYFGVYEPKIVPLKYNKKREEEFKRIINKQDPDVIHIWGTEYIHSYEMFQANCKRENIIVSIQGLISKCAESYLMGIPLRYKYSFTFRDLMRLDNLYFQSMKFKKRGFYERKLLTNIPNVIGRTAWDRQCTCTIQESVNYYHCGEILRKNFYEEKWELQNCKKHTIFISECSYSIKGFQFVLDLIPILEKNYSNLQVYVAGGRMNYPSGIIEHLKLSSFQKFILNKISKLRIDSRFIFLGDLSAEKMCEYYKRTHVMLLPSVIENSPNSLGEAMMLGVPCVAANVGGVSSMMEDGLEGKLYNVTDIKEMASAIRSIWDSDEKALLYSENARKRALLQYNIKKNVNDYLLVYKDICFNGSMKHDI